MGLIEYGPLGLLAALGLATAWTAAVTTFVLGLALLHSLTGSLIGRLTQKDVN